MENSLHTSGPIIFVRRLQTHLKVIGFHHTKTPTVEVPLKRKVRDAVGRIIKENVCCRKAYYILQLERKTFKGKQT